MIDTLHCALQTPFLAKGLGYFDDPELFTRPFRRLLLRDHFVHLDTSLAGVFWALL